MPAVTIEMAEKWLEEDEQTLEILKVELRKHPENKENLQAAIEVMKNRARVDKDMIRLLKRGISGVSTRQ